MISTQLNHQVLLENQLHEHRLVASIQAIEIHKLIVGITSAPLGEISVTTAGDKLLARSHGTDSWRYPRYIIEIFSRSYAKHAFALQDLHLLITPVFLTGVLLKIRKFGFEGGHELVHFFVRNDAQVAADSVIREFSVLVPPNLYHMNPVSSWTRMKPQPGSRMPQQDKSLFDEADVKFSRRQVRLPLEVFKNLPEGNLVLTKSNGEDLWRFRNVNDTLTEVQREDWFRTLYKRKVGNPDIDESEDSFSAENLPEVSARALTILADREVHR